MPFLNNTDYQNAINKVLSNANVLPESVGYEFFFNVDIGHSLNGLARDILLSFAVFFSFLCKLVASSLQKVTWASKFIST